MQIIKIIMFILCIVCISCGKVDPETVREMENAKNELEKIENQYEKKISDIQKHVLQYEEEKININSRYKAVISYKWHKFKKQVESITEEEFVKFSGHVPEEIFSGSNRISFENDMNGGWYIDKKSGVVLENIDNRIFIKNEITTEEKCYGIIKL